MTTPTPTPEWMKTTTPTPEWMREEPVKPVDPLDTTEQQTNDHFAGSTA